MLIGPLHKDTPRERAPTPAEISSILTNQLVTLGQALQLRPTLERVFAVEKVGTVVCWPDSRGLGTLNFEA